MNEIECFLKEMFEYFHQITENGKYECYRYLDYTDRINPEKLSQLAPFLKEMQYLTYDIKNAKIKMSTKNGEIYSLDDLISFNDENSNYLTVSGAGNENSSVTIDGGCAVIEFQVNRDYFKNDILKIQKAVKLIELIDTFDVYTIGLIKKRVLPVVEKYNLSEIYLCGDYAHGTPTKDSTLEFIINKKELEGFDYFIIDGEISKYFKCEVNIHDIDDENVNVEKAILLTG